jgi:hypothetical protein
MSGDETSTEEVTSRESGEEATEEPQAPSVSDGGNSSYNFDPQQNGFSFPNYGSDIPATNLTPYELRRMFGDQVCADINGDTAVDISDVILTLRMALVLDPLRLCSG